MKVTALVTNFTAGELSPKLDPRVDTKKYQNGAFTIENGIVMPHGGIRKRPGTKFIAELKSSTVEARLLPFQFNTEQSYMLEIGPTYIRQFKDQGIIVASSKVITGITKANPGVVTATGHGFANGDQVYISGVVGMTQVNNRRFTVAGAAANTFQLSGVNTTGYTTYTSGGLADKPVQTTTTYDATAIDALTYAQSADTMYLAHADHPTAKLTRSSHTAWTLSNADFQNGPFRQINVDDKHKIKPTLAALASSISAATQANPCVITTTSAHGLTDGAFISISGVLGMTQINSTELSVRNVTSTTFELFDDCGRAVNSTGYGAYTSGGSIGQTVSIWGTYAPGAKVTLTSSESLFSSNMVGTLFRLWEPGQSSAIRSPPLGSAYNVLATGDLYTKNGHVYGIQNLSIGGDWQKINDFPNHKSGTVHFNFNDFIGVNGDVVFLHDSFTVVEITAYTSATVATAVVRTGHVPKSVVTYGTAYWEEGAWNETRGYPGVVGFHEGRLFAAASTDSPQTVWASKTQAFEDFQDGAEDDQALTYTAASGRVDQFKWMMTGKNLVLGTSSSEYVAAASSQNEALTPSNVRMVPQTQYGSASSVQPVRVGNTILFGQRRGTQSNPARKIRELAYSFQEDNFVAADVTIVSDHITGTGITEMTYQADPDSVIYCRREDGQIAGLTYEADQDVKGWHRQILGGIFGNGDAVVERMATIPGTSADEVWLIVKRTINGATKRYIEVLTPGLLPETDPQDAVYLDSALTYDGTETSTITGLWHLEGETVYALADGAKQGPFTVASGAITLTTAASKVHVGLSYTLVVETTDIEAGAQAGAAKSRQKRISEIFLDLYRSLGGRCGPRGGSIDDIVYRTPSDEMSQAPGLRTGLERFEFPGGWEDKAIIRIEHDEPYPFNLLGIALELSTSG